jgi:hypothetical protein
MMWNFIGKEAIPKVKEREPIPPKTKKLQP